MALFTYIRFTTSTVEPVLTSPCLKGRRLHTLTGVTPARLGYRHSTAIKDAGQVVRAPGTNDLVRRHVHLERQKTRESTGTLYHV
jgi:hypothetical protein